ncbi:P-loop containing nucleoside triphosphate hydrolase protein [Fimicolochytrium jonesii]|uniref:P-loop containing nucleoside triphosphate hydrolase protein n=1 Tax=Fimicolochytrium jonesii TaxID=1396493 RepID=UPI0022FE34D0|nr:P-loop containing nucleoside triphosphate hydrolase protein [Fimicolochytrium jonesii]KAI8817602.1 P-loop containing nucleoside triphosphate hydrolase protein [Fimicolochytrium jonesii]
MDIDEEDQAAEAELDADEAEEGVDSDEEMNGLRDDMDTDIDALRAWMRQMEEQNGASDDEDQTEDDDGVEEDDNVDADEPIENLEANTSKPFASPRKHTLPDTNHFELENESSGLPEEKAIMGDDPVPHSPFSLSSGASHPEDDDTNAAFQSPPPNANLGTTSLTSISTSAEVDGNLGHDAAKSERDNEAQNQNETPIPFLLKHTLREYQHVGLSWLAGLYQKGLNGILADEMGLGKTIQTISLFAHLAVDRGVWGPHLIVVPTSVMLNWECEFKKWLPGFKLLTYYGNIAERAAKRVGWLKPNSFHVCITSYQIVLRDQHIFRRKRWCYLVLDEAHNIKNFRSQRWQTLLGFNTERRLLLTGTPLQNSLMELWSLLYFLMPAAGGPGGQTEGGFAGRQEFKEWFEGSVSSLIGDGSGMPNDALTTDSADADTRESVARLHAVLRPYILRRLKADVEKQMPAKYEHVVTCRLSKRQRFLYDDFMSRAKTKADLASGNYLSIVNVLMQLRKVCNHPNLFEERPVVTGFALPEGGVPGRLLKLEEILVWKKLLREIDSVVSMARIGLDIVNPDREGPHGWTRLESQRLTKWAAWREIQQSLDEAVDAEVQTRALLPKDGQVRTLAAWKLVKQWHNAKDKVHWWQTLKRSNRLRCRHALAGIAPMYGRDVIRLCRSLGEREVEVIVHASDDPSRMGSYSTYLRQAVLTPEERLATVIEYIDRFVCVTPRARVHPFRTNIPTPGLIYPRSADSYDAVCPVDVLGFAKTRLEISFPDKRLVQFDCGKLQMLDKILKEMKPGGHRALIFTQMTKMLDILEVFLNLHGHRYLRLDGSTKVEQRQVLMERFNNDKRILVFILSTRSGGIGMNLTGADRVIFYDSDWNPAMDAQAQDRAHRIGQTREVHIYRFVSAHTIEENMLRKANQKRRLDQLVIRAGDFTTEWISKNNSNTTLQWQDWLDAGNLTESGDGTQSGPELQPKQIRPETAAGAPADASVWEQAIMQAEDETDVAAAKMATMEFQQDIADFSESGTVPAPSTTLAATGAALERHARTLAKNGGKSSSAVTEPAATSSDPIDRSEISGRETGSPSPSPVVDSASSTPLKPPIPEPGPLDEYLFRLQLYRMNLEHLFDWRDFADELNRVAQEVLQREQAERNAQEELNNRMNGVLGCTVEL